MTVSELIELLRDMPADLPVVTADDAHYNDILAPKLIERIVMPDNRPQPALLLE